MLEVKSWGFSDFTKFESLSSLLHVTYTTPHFGQFFIFSVVSVAINVYVKFLVCILRRSTDIIAGSQNLKSSRNLGHAPFWQIFIFRLSIPYPQSACKIWVLYFQPFRIYQGGPKFEKYVTWPSNAPFWPNFSFPRLLSLTFNLHAKFEVCTFSRSRDNRGSQNLKNRSRDLGHALFWPFFIFLV